MNTSYLVTGATGAIGYAFTRALLDAGESAIVLVRDRSKALELFGYQPTLNIVEGDVNDTELLKQHAQGIEFIFHGTNVSYEHWEKAMPVMTNSIIEAAEVSGATVIFPGNNYNYGPSKQPISEITPFNPSAATGRVRVQLEQMLQHATDQGRITTLVVRMAELWGPNVTNKMFAPVFENVLRGKAMPWLATTQVPQQLLYNLDAGRAILALTQREIRQPYEVFNLAGSLVPSMDSWLREIADVAGKSARISILPKPMISLLALFLPVMREVKSLIYKYEMSILLTEEKFSAQFPEYRQTPMRQAIANTLQWFRHNGQHSDENIVNRNQKRKQSMYRFAIDNAAIGLFPFVIALLGTQIEFLANNGVMFGVVAGIYWTPGLHALALKLFPRIIRPISERTQKVTSPSIS